MKPILAMMITLLAAACDTVQTSSGSDYIAAYDNSTTKATRSSNAFDEDLRLAAGVDPLLKLPAKIGIARIVNGKITSIPEGEVALISKIQERHRNFGTFVPVNPMIARATVRDIGKYRYSERNSPLHFIRLGAARQHLDAVLVYEIGARTRYRSKTLQDVSVLSANSFLPPRKTAAQAVAQVIMIDVRNGYVYATATAEADVSTILGKIGGKADEKRDKAARTVLVQLLPKVDAALSELSRHLKKR